MSKCGDQVPKCVICAGPHKIGYHQCGVIGYINKRGKICTHMIIKYTNYKSNQSANSNQFTSRYKVETNARREKKLDKDKAKVVKTSERNNKVHDKANSGPDIGMDLEAKDWANSAELEESSSQGSIEGTDYI